MLRVLYRIAVAALTFGAGVAAVAIIHRPRPRPPRQLPARAQAAEELRPPQPPRQAPAAAEPAVEDREDKLEKFSPYDIEFFVNAHPQADPKVIWRHFGVRPESDVEPDFFNNCTNCEARSDRYDLDEEPGREVVLRISDDLQEACRYLIFKYVEGGSPPDDWKLLGNIDHGFGRYVMPQHYKVASGGKNWLVVEVQGASGSGVAHYYSRLFQVSAHGIKEVLSFTSDGHQEGIGFEPSRDFSSRILDCKVRGGSASVEIEYAVKYAYGDLTLFGGRQKATYGGRMSGGLALDARRSELSAEEVEAVYNIDSLSREDFLKYNYEKLAGLAAGRDGKKKAWLRQFLGGCENTPEKEALFKRLT